MSKIDYSMVFREEGVAYQAGSQMDWVKLARKGVSKHALLTLAETGAIGYKTLAGLLPVSERTLQRYSQKQRFGLEVSEHIILIARVLKRAEEVFGDMNAVKYWMNSPNLSFGNQTPVSLLDTSFGAELLMDELGRIEHGVIS